MKVILETKKSKQTNAKVGDTFEACVVKALLPRTGAIQADISRAPSNIVSDAQSCTKSIRRFLKKIGFKLVDATQCGRNQRTGTGDILLSNGERQLRMEMKYIRGTNVKYHNPSVDLFANQFPEAGFITAIDALKVKVGDVTRKVEEVTGIPPGRMEYDVVDGLKFVLNPNMTCFQTLCDILEPLKNNAEQYPQMGLDQYPKVQNNPLGQSTGFWREIKDVTILVPDKGRVVCHSELDDGGKPLKSRSWVVDRQFSDIVVSPRDIYFNVLQRFGMLVLSYIGAYNFDLIINDPKLPTEIMSMFCEKKESAGLVDSKRPDYLVVFNRMNGQTSVFDCENYRAEESDEISISPLTPNRWLLGNQNIKFKIQFRWKDGPFANPAAQVEIPKMQIG